jgi:uncharacterized membrane protein YphA (DoxX/SURF4 family)
MTPVLNALEGEGYEYHILALVICLVIIIRGSGALSIDRSASREP